VQEPVSSQAGAPISVRVQVCDAFDNVVRNYAGPIMLSLDNGGTFLSSSASTADMVVSAKEGEASFNVAIQRVNTSYHLTASGDSLTSAVSKSFDISFVIFAKDACIRERCTRVKMSMCTMHMQGTEPSDR
jgi:hypothetical protein